MRAVYRVMKRNGAIVALFLDRGGIGGASCAAWYAGAGLGFANPQAIIRNSRSATRAEIASLKASINNVATAETEVI